MFRWRISLLLTLSGILFVSVSAQLPYKVIEDIPVFYGEIKLKYPWVGGLNSPQFNTIDLNDDGKNDLALFDRFANKVFTFLAQDDDFNYAPEYEKKFPKGLNYWMLLRDFNGDGKKDIFSGHWQGVVVYVNTSTTTSELSWRAFNLGNPLLTTDFSNALINLPVNPNDIPVIDDIDQDGDLDFLSAHVSGNTGIEFNRNESIDVNHNKDSLLFSRVTIQWGNMLDCTCGRFAFNGTFCVGGRTNHTGAKAMLTYDYDEDGDLDLFYSDEFCDNIYLLRNTGNSQAPEFKSIEALLSESIPFFPAAYVEDIDSDGKPDLLMASNQAERTSIPPNFSKSSWRVNSDFIIAQRNFVQQDMIDVGDDAVPTFADYDNDGDLDLFVGNYSDGQNGKIAYYRNTGLTYQPEYHLVTDDFLELSKEKMVSIKPVFADVTGDGHQDLVFTAFGLVNSNYGVFYLENTAKAGFDFSTSSLQTLSFTIWNEKVTFTDYNGDGKQDIIKGNFVGGIELWLNVDGQYVKSNVLDYLGENYGRLSPFLHVSDLDADGKDDLIISGSQGQVFVVRNYKKSTSEEEVVHLFDSGSGSYEYRSLGGRLFATTAKITDPVRPQIIVGTSTGGLLLLEQSSEDVEFYFDLFPNPVLQTDRLIAKSSQTGIIAVYTITGASFLSGNNIQANTFLEFDVSHWPRGVYLVKLKTADRVITKRVIITQE